MKARRTGTIRNAVSMVLLHSWTRQVGRKRKRFPPVLPKNTTKLDRVLLKAPFSVLSLLFILL